MSYRCNNNCNKGSSKSNSSSSNGNIVIVMVISIIMHSDFNTTDIYQRIGFLDCGT